MAEPRLLSAGIVDAHFGHNVRVGAHAERGPVLLVADTSQAA